jgi:hypothetical protein
MNFPFNYSREIIISSLPGVVKQNVGSFSALSLQLSSKAKPENKGDGSIFLVKQG